jgi:fructuronate reductase
MLSDASLAQRCVTRADTVLSSTWERPDIGIVHLGIGNFHRAHEAVYTEEAMVAAGGAWGICGVTLQGDVGKREALMRQDGLYTVLERGPQGVKATVIRALREVLALPQDRVRLFRLLTNSGTRIVSLTVTEKGYCRAPETGDVNLQHPGIVLDLQQPRSPATVPGILVEALRLRHQAGIAPFAVLSCDNLSHNGTALKQVVCSFAAQRDAALATWIEQKVSFPSTMVDRIVPATTDDDRDAVSTSLQLLDTVPVPCEPFRQWVVEDRFPNGRPAWERVGVQMVDDVTPFELAKLRMLNGAHSAIAYLSMLAGLVTVDQAIAYPPMRTFIRSMMTDEIAPTLSMPTGFDLYAYRDALLERFANPQLKHRCAQIAMDGSQKIPPRILDTIAHRLRYDENIDALTMTVAAWLVFLRGHADDGTPYAIQDPAADALQSLAREANGDPARLVDNALAYRGVFPVHLAENVRFRGALISAVRLVQADAKKAIEQLVSNNRSPVADC